MSIASALHSSPNEIATIATCETRIEAARIDLAALDQAARLFDSGDGSDEEAIDGDLMMLGNLDAISATDREPLQLEQGLATRRLGPHGGEEKGFQYENASPIPSPQLRKTLAYFATQPAGRQAPNEFFN